MHIHTLSPIFQFLYINSTDKKNITLDLESECEYHEIDIDYWANDNGVVLLADEDTTINTNVTLSQQIIQL